MTTLEILSLLSPFVSAALTALLTYTFTLRSKKIDILYQNKMPAFKEVAIKLISFKTFCEGRVAYFQGNEYAPFYEENLGALQHRTEIAKSIELNGIFLSTDSRHVIEKLLGDMSGLCNAEAYIAGGNDDINPQNEYQRMAISTESIIEILYNELNLIKK